MFVRGGGEEEAAAGWWKFISESRPDFGYRVILGSGQDESLRESQTSEAADEQVEVALCHLDDRREDIYTRGAGFCRRWISVDRVRIIGGES